MLALQTDLRKGLGRPMSQTLVLGTKSSVGGRGTPRLPIADEGDG